MSEDVDLDADETKPMTLDEYLAFLDEYWEIFGDPPPRKPRFEVDRILF